MTELLLLDAKPDVQLAAEVELCFSNMNFSPLFIATAGVERHRQALSRIEEEGPLFAGHYDLTPTRRLAADSVMDRLSAVDVATLRQQERFASRVHQAWPQRPWVGRSALNAAAYMVMPETRGSRRTLRRMSRQLGGVTACVYGDQQDRHGELMDFTDLETECATQLTPEVVQANGAYTDFSKLPASLRRRGISRLIIDNHHLVRGADENGDDHLDHEKTLDDVESGDMAIEGLHAAAGRTDGKHRDDRERSLNELSIVLDKPDALEEETLMGQVLARGYRIWQAQRRRGLTSALLLPVTTEVPLSGLEAYRQAEITQADFVKLHRDYAQNLMGFFASLAL